MSPGECEYFLLKFTHSIVCSISKNGPLAWCFVNVRLQFILTRCLLFVVKIRKLLLPSFAALPLLMAYAGHTTIIIPKPLIPYLGMDVLDLGKISNNIFMLEMECM